MSSTSLWMASPKLSLPFSQLMTGCRTSHAVQSSVTATVSSGSPNAAPLNVDQPFVPSVVLHVTSSVQSSVTADADSVPTPDSGTTRRFSVALETMAPGGSSPSTSNFSNACQCLMSCA